MDKSIVDILRKIILQETVYLRHYIGQVLLTTDPIGIGRICVAVPELGIGTADVGFWCSPRDKKGLITPQINDWVEVYFMSGDKNRPVYMGIASEMKEMLPASYKPGTQVIFETNDKSFHVTHDGSAMEIGASGFSGVARTNDSITITAVTDPAFFAWMATVTPPYVPAAITGKISGGSTTVKAGA